MPNCFIIAGPNGAGKTTFALEFLPQEGDCVEFVNADMIAAGISPLSPEAHAFKAGRIHLEQIDDLAGSQVDFAFETTLSGLVYLRRIETWRNQGYSITLFYLRLPSPEFAIARVAKRVSEGGHNITDEVVRRRFAKGLKNLPLYQEAVNDWSIFDNSEGLPKLVGNG